MQTTLRHALILFLGVGSFFATSCEREKTPDTGNEEEAITTVRLTLTRQDGTGTPIIATWKQLDLSGNTPPDTSAAVLNLSPNTTYVARLLLLNEAAIPVDTISKEVLEEANEHIVFYQPTNTSGVLTIPGTPNNPSGSLLNLTITPQDLDTNNPPLPIGLETIFSTGANSSGRVRVVLRHQPNVKDGTYAPGSTDVDATFRVNITN